MRLMRYLFAIVWVCATATEAVAAALEPPSATAVALNHDVVTGARCRVRCLSLLKLTIDVPLLSNVKEATSLMNCLRDTDCMMCLKPCNQPVLGQDHCEDVCRFPKEDRLCSDSCSFLKEIKQADSGVCPSSSFNEANISRAQSCGKSCIIDKNCDKNLKCCATPCGTSCRKPLFPQSSDLPDVPQIPSLREKPRGGSVELKWHSVMSSSTGPILYIVDYRWNIGKRYNEFNMTSWQHIAQTTGTSAVINDITPGHWYQFRVSSVNIHGSQGGSQPTQAFTLSKEPRKPGPPTNLTEGDTLLVGGKKMAVTIRWFPPLKSDLPITRYKLYWSKRLRSAAANSREFRKVLPGNRLTFQIPSLDSATTYVVQVQAICQYGDVKLKSEKASIYITTYPQPNPADEYAVPSESAGASRALPTPGPVETLLVERPFYDNGILKANVSWQFRQDDEGVNIKKVLLYWSPEACIADSSMSDDSLSRIMSSSTSENHFVIGDLRADCRYMVKVETVSSQGAMGRPVLLSFSTPSCGQAQIFGKLQPDCLVPRVPEEPPDLVHTFLISNSNVTSKLSWGVPASDSPINGYRVVWGPLLRSHHPSPVMDKLSTFTKVLSKDVRSLSVGNLLEGTTYLVRVQAFSKFGPGHIASIQFATPLLQVAPDQVYREVLNVDGKKQDVSKKKGVNLLTAATTTTLSMLLTIEPRRFDHSIPRHQTVSLASSISSNSFLFSIIICLSLQSFVKFCPVLLTH